MSDIKEYSVAGNSVTGNGIQINGPIIYHSSVDAKHEQSNLADSMMQRIKKWLSPVDAESYFLRALSARHPGTGSWLLKHGNFQSWKSGDDRLLWMYGIPGAGKSILASTVIEHLKCEKGRYTASSVSYFFCSFSDPETLEPVKILASFIWQLVLQSPAAKSKIISIIENDALAYSTPKMEILGDVLTSMLGCFETNQLIIDGLDEMTTGNASTLCQCLTSQARAKLLVISRPGIGDEPPRFLTTGLNIVIEEKMVHMDISLYVKQFVEEELAERLKEPTLREEVVKRLVDGSHGMFRWVRCQLEILENARTESDIWSALAGLPPSLTETYKRVLKGIKERDRELARRVLLWLTLSTRPLRLKELAEAVTIEQDSKMLDTKKRLLVSTDILKVCGSLVAMPKERRVSNGEMDESAGHGGPVDQTTNPLFDGIDGLQVVLAHYSVKEYLLSTEIEASEVGYFAVRRIGGHSELASICLTYLLFDDFTSGPCNMFYSAFNRLLQYPFYPYAANAWFIHVRNSHCDLGNEDTDDENDIKTTSGLLVKSLEFFDPDRLPNLAAWVQMLVHHDRKNILCMDASRSVDFTINGDVERVGCALYYASICRLKDVVRELVLNRDGVDVDGCIEGFSPLIAATRQGDVGIATFLLDHGADSSATTADGATALHIAVQNGNTDLVELLARKGTPGAIDAVDRDGLTPFMVAVKWGRAELVQTLCELGANLYTLDKCSRTALMLAWEMRHTRIAMMLRPMMEGTDSRYPDHMGNSALHWAAFHSNEVECQRLLENGHQSSPQNIVSQTPLHVACRTGNEDLITLMIKSGCDLWVQDNGGNSAIQSLMNGHHTSLVDKILSATDLGERKIELLQTCLNWAVIHGSSSMVEFVLKHGADPNGVEDRGMWEVLSGHRFTALHFACLFPFAYSVIDTLIQGGADINGRNLYGQTPLHNAAQQNHSGNKAIQKLISYEAPLDAADKNGYTPIMTAVKGNQYGKVHFLISFIKNNRPDILEMVDTSGNTAVLLASFHGYEAILVLLLESGANPMAKNSSGDNGLMIAVAQGHVAIAMNLLLVWSKERREEVELALELARQVEEGDELVACFDSWLSQMYEDRPVDEE